MLIAAIEKNIIYLENEMVMVMGARYGVLNKKTKNYQRFQVFTRFLNKNLWTVLHNFFED